LLGSKIKINVISPKLIEAMKMCMIRNCCGGPYHFIGGSGNKNCMAWLVCDILVYDIVSLKDVISSRDLLG